jgi:tetratricopeptide (TPR) repeat protein
MRICPGCAREFPDSKKYCGHCGEPLSPRGTPERSPETETQRETARPVNCPFCGKTVSSPEAKFCKDCGASIVYEEPVPAEPEPATPRAPDARQTEKPAPLATRKAHPGGLWGNPLSFAIAGAALVAIVLGYFYLWPSSKAEILSKVAQANLVMPAGESAYDLFLQHRERLGRADMDEIGRAAVPALKQRGEEIIVRLKRDGIESEEDWAECARAYEWLTQLEPNPQSQARYYFAQGRLSFMRGQNEEAMRHYRESIERDDSAALVLNSMARAVLRTGDRRAAEDFYQRAARAEPDWPIPWLNLGGLYWQDKNYLAAVGHLRHVLSLDGSNLWARSVLAQSLEGIDRPCEALVEYGAVLEQPEEASASGVDVDLVRRRAGRISTRYRCY